MNTHTQEALVRLDDIISEAIQMNKSLEAILTELRRGKHAGAPEHQYATGKYDWNIYVRDYDTLSVTAYPLVLNAEGDAVGTDNSNFLSLHVPLNFAHDEVVSYLLGTTKWENEVWIDHDDWVAEDFLNCPEAPAVVQGFVKTINQLSYKEFVLLAKEQNQ